MPPIVSRYIAIEGGDGSGKSTVSAELETRLRRSGEKTLIVREPGSTALGEEIREILLHGTDMTPWAEALLFAAQRAQLASEVVGPALADGIWVISDRTYYSSMAYQGGARSLGIDVVRQVNEAGLGGVTPDLVFILDVDVSEALSRQDRPDRIGSEEADFHESVRIAYRSLAESEPDRVFLIDNSKDLAGVVDQIMEHLQ